jgi:hypothetical protein
MNNNRRHAEMEHSGVALPPMKVRIQAARLPGWTVPIYSVKLPSLAQRLSRKANHERTTVPV